MSHPEPLIRTLCIALAMSVSLVVGCAGVEPRDSAQAAEAPAAPVASPVISADAPAAPVTPAAPATGPRSELPAAVAEPVEPKAAAPGVQSSGAEPVPTVKPAPVPRAVPRPPPTAAAAAPVAKTAPPRPPPPASPAPAVPAPPPAPAARAVAKPAVAQVAVPPAPLDLKSLENRLRETRAIGVMTKLSLKNQVDDLVDGFRAYHKRQATTKLDDLRRSYDLLLMKVLSLLQDSDPGLARDINKSRTAIWSILADPRKFTESNLMAGDQ